MERRNYYWITATEPATGRPYLIFGGVTEEEARQKGLVELPGINFEIVPLPTTNHARASSLVKGRRLGTTHSLTQASRRLGHEKTVRRRKKSHRFGDIDPLID